VHSVSSQGYINKAWNGEIKLGQSICLSFVGLICAFVFSFIIGSSALWLKANGHIDYNIIPFNNFTSITLVILFSVFTIRSVWKCASTPKLKIKHAIARLWAVLLGVYVIALSYNIGVN